MNLIDIIIGLLLLYALYRGWSGGVLVQLSGIMGIVVGAWLAFNFSQRVCEWFEIEIDYKWLVFVAILIGVIITVIILSRIITKVLSMGGLSIPIKFLGAAVSAVKVVIIIALIMRTFENINAHGKFTEDNYLKQSVSYSPLDRVATAIFPYLNSWLETPENETDKILK